MNRAVTPAALWKPVTFEEVLPSGKVARLKKPDIVGLVMSSDNGDVPDWLTGMVAREITGEHRDVEMFTGNDSEDRKRLAGLGTFMEKLVRLAFVEPRIAPASREPDYEAGEIAYSDLDSTDKMWVMNWSMPRGRDAAEAFPAEQAGRVDAAPHSEGLRIEAEPAAGD
jgi:hypothetical protein